MYDFALIQNFETEKTDVDGLGNYDPAKKIQMGFNFTIRPYSNLGKRDKELSSKLDASKTGEIERYLTKMRKMTKQTN